MNDTTIFLFGTLGMSAMALSIVTFAFLYQAKMKRKADEVRQVKDLLQRTEFDAMQRFIQGQHEEQKRIARELHDGIGSSLATLKYRLDHVQNDTQWLKQEIDELLDNLRDVSHALHKGMFVYHHLNEIITDYIQEIAKQTGLHIDWNSHGLNDNPSEKLGKHLFRIVQELLHNALKHAHATRVSFDVHYFVGDQMNLIYTDDGVGFDPDAVSEGIGLRTIRERAKEIHGEVRIVSGKPRGVEIIIECNLIWIK